MKPLTKQPPLTEAQFQRIVLDLARTLGYSAYHTHDSRRSQAGYPDLHLWKPGRSLFVELKSDKGRLRPAQVTCLDGLRAAGCEVWLFRPADWSRVVEVLSGVTPKLPDLPGQVYLFAGDEECQ